MKKLILAAALILVAAVLFSPLTAQTPEPQPRAEACVAQAVAACGGIYRVASVKLKRCSADPTGFCCVFRCVGDPVFASCEA